MAGAISIIVKSDIASFDKLALLAIFKLLVVFLNGKWYGPVEDRECKELPKQYSKCKEESLQTGVTTPNSRKVCTDKGHLGRL